MERYLRLLNYQSNSTVSEMAYQICKFQLNDALFLDYRPSEIAAASVLLSINIYEEDLQNTTKNSSFFTGKTNGLLELNTAIWNQEVASVSGYSFESIKPCIYDLAIFISNNLSPNRLASFNLETLKPAK